MRNWLRFSRTHERDARIEGDGTDDCSTSTIDEVPPVIGKIEMFGKDFACGWLARRRESDFLELHVGDDAVVAHTFSSPRADIEAPPGTKIMGFVCPFDRVLRDGDHVVVRTNGGDQLEGSPLIYRPAVAGATAQIHVESPTSTIFRSLIAVSGWVRFHGTPVDLTFFVNGREQDVRYQARPDVTDGLRTPFALGWSFTLDVAGALGQAPSCDMQVVCNGTAIFRHRFHAQLRSMDDALVLFMHIPKTAGISLVEAIKAEKTLDSHWLYGDMRFPVDRQLARLSSGAFDDLDVLGGHFTYGIHRQIDRACVYLTLLREPLAYLKSYFIYRKYVQRWPPVQALDIYGAIARGVDPLLDNGMTRFFASKPSGPLDADDRARALQTMERFAFVGLVERMDETVARVASMLRTPLAIRHDNPTPPCAEAAAIDMAELARFAEPFIAHDRALYRQARRLFWSDDHDTPPPR